MIEQHGAQAALRVVERVNEQIDQRDWSGRDQWTDSKSGQSSMAAKCHRSMVNETKPSETSPSGTDFARQWS